MWLLNPSAQSLYPGGPPNQTGAATAELMTHTPKEAVKFRVTPPNIMFRPLGHKLYLQAPDSQPYFPAPGPFKTDRGCVQVLGGVVCIELASGHV